MAKRRVPLPVFDYVDGGAENELSLARNRAAFEAVEFSPRVLRDVGSVDGSTTIAGYPSPLPIVLGPTGFTRMMHTDGELAVAAAAAAHGVPYVLSTMATTVPEEVRAVGGSTWFLADLEPEMVALGAG